MSQKLVRPDWRTLALTGLLVTAFLPELFAGLPFSVNRFGLSGAALAEGRLYTLVTYMFVHGGIWHIWMNASGLLAVGVVVGQHFGGSPRGTAAYFTFFLLLGVLSSLGYLALHPFGATPMVGASGAICGFWGAASRLLDPEHKLSPITSPLVRQNAVELIKSNIALVGMFLVLGFLSGRAGVFIAWEAHVAGFIAGLVLVGPFLDFARPEPMP